MKFRTKSTTVEAIKWGGQHDINRVINWLAHHGANLKGWMFHDADITVYTGGQLGAVVAYPGDWIVLDSDGVTYYVMNDVGFKAKYEAVEGIDAISSLTTPLIPVQDEADDVCRHCGCHISYSRVRDMWEHDAVVATMTCMVPAPKNYRMVWVK